MVEVQGGDAVVSTTSARTWIKDTLERVVSTAIQAFLTYIVVADGIDLSAKNAAFAAAITAGLVALKQALMAITIPVFPNRWADLLARSSWTFLQTGVTLVAVEGFDWGDLTAWQGVAIAGGASVLTLVKGFAADKFTGSNESPTVTPASFVKPASDQVVALPAAA